MSLYQQITDYYENNKEFYQSLQKKISKNVNGRICHHNVKVLNTIASLLDIKTYLEIGVHNGTSMSYVVSQDKRPIKCYGVDLFKHTVRQYKRDKLDIRSTLQNIQASNVSNSKIVLVTGDSTKKETINKFRNKEIDLFFIDGDHGYEGVKQDFENYIPFVKKDGIIVFDDYHSSWPGVVRFVNELSKNAAFTKIGLFFNNEMVFQKTGDL